MFKDNLKLNNMTPKITKHIFICVTDVNGNRYAIEVPPQQENMSRIKDTIHQIQTNKEFIGGRLHRDDVANMFTINGLVAKVKMDFKIMYLNPAIQKALDEKTKTEALDIIQGVVMEYYHINKDRSQAKLRHREFMVYKEMFCYIALTRYPRCTQEEVAAKVGYKTHVTAWHHKNKIASFIENEYQTFIDDSNNIDTRLSIKLLGINKGISEDFVLKSLEE